MYQWLADAVLLVHALFVLFVVATVPLVLLGARAGWRWVRSLPFRIAHLLAIAIVVAQAWIGMLCPLTTLESRLRSKAGATGYEGTFVQHWLHEAIYYNAPGWVFAMIYTLFALLVLATWLAVPPRREQRDD